MARAEGQYSDNFMDDDGSNKMIDFSLTNESCDNLEPNDGKKRKKKKRISCKKLSLISKAKSLRDEDVDSKLKRVCTQSSKLSTMNYNNFMVTRIIIQEGCINLT